MPFVPASLIAVLLGTVAIAVLDLQAKGVQIVGEIDAGLGAVALPDVGGPDGYLAPAGPRPAC